MISADNVPESALRNPDCATTARAEHPAPATARAAGLAAAMLAADFSAVFVGHAGARRLRMAAGVGWRAGLVGNYELKLSFESFDQCVRRMSWPIIIDDLLAQTWISRPRLLLDHHVRSALSVLIPGAPHPYGLLAVYSAQRRRFDQAESNQLQAVADLLGAAIDQAAADGAPPQKRPIVCAVMEASLDAIVLVSLEDLRVAEVNHAFEQLLGADRATVIGRTPAAIGLAEEPATLEALIGEVRAGACVRGRPLQLRAVDGRTIAAIAAASAAEIDGRPGLALVLRDNRDQSRAAEALAQARQAAHEVARMKAAFLANTSHEIRTPLNVILGYSELIGEHLAEVGDDSQAAYLEAIQRAGRRLIGTIDGILDYSRIEAGVLELRPEELALGPLIRRIAAALRPLAIAAGLGLECAIDEPAAAVRFDRHSLENAFTAVLHNAIKFTERGQIAVRLARTPAGILTLSVSDTGVGIEESYLARLFEPFSQEQSSPARRYEGAGLGLALAHRYVRLNGGTLEVASIKGVGTTVTFGFAADAPGAPLGNLCTS
ncbi:MAG: PAS domain S-box protein [Candidatus Binataceae bacterium]|nr:PAS domain S-box protein [Candidatus Binataceae bacterium]